MQLPEQILRLQYHEEINVVEMVWSGFSGKNEFRESNEEVLNLLKEKYSHKLLADLRNMKIITIADQQWLYNNWLPRAIASGLQKVAIVESEDYFNRLTVDNVVQHLSEQLTIKYFSNYLSARNWLKQ